MDLETPEWGLVKLLVATPSPGDPWGVLAPLRGTSWGKQVSVVRGEDLSHALHGWVVPLMRVIGIDPKHRGQRVDPAEGACALRAGCMGAKPSCHAGSKATPGCFEAEGIDGIATDVLMAWQEGRYVVVVEGDEFSF